MMNSEVEYMLCDESALILHYVAYSKCRHILVLKSPNTAGWSGQLHLFLLFFKFTYTIITSCIGLILTGDCSWFGFIQSTACCHSEKACHICQLITSYDDILMFSCRCQSDILEAPTTVTVRLAAGRLTICHFITSYPPTAVPQLSPLICLRMNS